MKNLTLLALFISFIAFSQQFDTEKFKNIETRAIGPAGMSGRVTAVDVVNLYKENPEPFEANKNVKRKTPGV